VIAEGNYGQTEGVFLCLLSFARAKKVRRLPSATSTTSTAQGLSPQLRGLSRISSLRHNALKPGTVPWSAGTVPITAVNGSDDSTQKFLERSKQ
jgi:hypothetical protein